MESAVEYDYANDMLIVNSRKDAHDMQNKFSRRNPVYFDRYMIILDGTTNAICIGEGAVPEEIIENYYPRRLEYNDQNDLWEIYVRRVRRKHYAKD